MLSLTSTGPSYTPSQSCCTRPCPHCLSACSDTSRHLPLPATCRPADRHLPEPATCCRPLATAAPRTRVTRTPPVTHALRTGAVRACGEGQGWAGVWAHGRVSWIAGMCCCAAVLCCCMLICTCLLHLQATGSTSTAAALWDVSVAAECCCWVLLLGVAECRCSCTLSHANTHAAFCKHHALFPCTYPKPLHHYCFFFTPPAPHARPHSPTQQPTARAARAPSTAWSPTCTSPTKSWRACRRVSPGIYQSISQCLLLTSNLQVHGGLMR